MRNKRKVSLLFTSIFTFTMGIVAMVSMFYVPKVETINADTVLTVLPDEITFEAQKVSIPITSMSGTKYNYGDSIPTYSESMKIEDIENSTATKLTPVMLNNYMKTASTSAEAVYIKLGDSLSEISSRSIGDDVTFMTITSHSLTVNGTQVSLSSEEFDNMYSFTEYGEIAATTATGEVTNFVHDDFVLWLDLNHFTTEGQYDITFNFSYLTATKGPNNTYLDAQVVTGQTYTFSFLLIGQESYATQVGYSDEFAVTYNNYPEFVNFQDYKLDANDTSTYTTADGLLNYFYNFTTRTAPRLQYNAELYNVSYSYIRDNVITLVTSDSVMGADGRLQIRFYTNGTLSNTIYLETTDMTEGATDKYIATLEFTEFGSYDFTFKYQSRLRDGSYYILDDIEVEYYQMYAVYGLEKDSFTHGRAVLDIYGTKAYFNKTASDGSGLSQLFYKYQDDDDTYVFDADFTSRFTALSYIDSISGTDTNIYSNFKELSNPNPIYDTNSDILIPSLNLAPVSFVYYGSARRQSNGSLMSNYSRYSDITSTTRVTTRYFSDTDSSISNSTIGFYIVELVYDYTSYFDPSIARTGTQYYMFEIISGQPNVSLKTTSTTSKPDGGYSDLGDTLANNKYTRENVVFSIGYDPITEKQDYREYEYFCKPIEAQVQYGGDDYGTNYQNLVSSVRSIFSDSPTYITTSGNYSLVVKYGSTGANQKTYRFTVDKDPISGIGAYSVQPKYNSSNIREAFVQGEQLNTNIINQYFGLDFDQKSSGAKITVQYQKIELSSYDDFGKLYERNDRYYITTNTALNLSQINASSSKLIYNYNLSADGVYSTSSVLCPATTSIYYFYFTDEAGWTSTYAILYDNSTPYIYIEPTPTNIFNIISATTQVYWGNYKAITVTGSLREDGDSTLNQDFVTSMLTHLGLNQTTTVTEHGSANTIDVLSIPMGSSSVLKASSTGTVTRDYTNTAYATLNATNEGSDNLSTASFVGEATYKITAMDNLSNSTATTIEMNFDNSMSMVFSGQVGDTSSSDNKVIQMSTNLVKVTNKNALYFSYLNTVEGYILNEADVEYIYFPVSQSAYASVTSLDELNALTTLPSDLQSELGGVSAFNLAYPYIVSDSVWQTVSIDSAFDQTRLCNTEGVSATTDDGRVVSGVINPTTVNGSTCTKEGLYVIKRTYNNTLDENLGNDSKVKYFIVKVDRSSIINIDPSTVDTDSNGNKTYDTEYYFQNGASIKFTLGRTKQSILDALNIQTYLNNENPGDKFSTSKIPLNIVIPTHKYNAHTALSMLSTTENESILDSNSITSIANAYDIFNLQCTLVCRYGGVDTIVNPTSTSNGLSVYDISQEGRYTLTISWVAQGYNVGLDILDSESFSFEVSYNIPLGRFTSTADRNNIVYTSTGSAPITQDFTYTNSRDALYFEFDDYDSTLDARVDLSNVVITTPNSSYTLNFSDPEVLYVNNSISSNTSIVNIDPELTTTSRTRYYISLYELAGFREGSYSVELKYYDYTNAYRSISTIVVDTTNPTLNLNSLVQNDKFFSNKSDINTKTYFFAVDQNTTLTNNNSRLETQNIYFRKLADAGNSIPNYSQIANFDPSLASMDGYNYHTINWNSMFDSEDADTSTTTYGEIFAMFENQVYGYYEVIEVDEAGNYVVYAVYYNEVSDNLPVGTIIYNTYNDVSILDENKQEKSFTLPYNDTETTYDVSGAGLKIGVDDTYIADSYYKVIIRNTITGATLNTFSYAPEAYSSYSDYFTQINNYISSLENATTKVCYNFTITLVNRFGSNFTITYRIPSEKLQLSFIPRSSTTFSVIIPSDSLNSTEIVEFRAYKFMNNTWIELSQDNSTTPKRIENVKTSTVSLSNLTYLFNSGMYRFTYVDNFGRNETKYYGIGVGTSKNYSYLSGSITINGISYTAGTVQLSYEASAYQCVISYYDETTGVYVPYIYDANAPFRAVISENNRQRIVTFSLTRDNLLLDKIRFKVALIPTNEDATDETVIESNSDIFEITYVLQEVTLTNLSGIVISGISHSQQSPTELSEDVYVVWDDEDMFGATVRLTNLTTGVSSNIQNGYKISSQGLYRVEITNGLGYTNSANTIFFRRIASSVSTYEVVAIDNGTETSLVASPVQQIYTDEDGNLYPVSIYYALDTYGEPTFIGAEEENTRDRYILIRSNSSKNLSVSKVEDATLIGLYKISGTGTYGYEKYIQIISIPETQALFSSNDDISLMGNEEEPIVYSITTTSNISSSAVTLRWKAFYEYEEGKHEDRIYADMYFNGTHIRTIYSTDIETLTNEITMSSSGYYEFYFYDLAGNNQFTISNTTLSSLSFYIVNSVMFEVNGDVAIDNQIFNSSVRISLTNRNLYETSAPVEITATRNGSAISVSNVGTGSNYAYNFSGQGRYVVTMRAFLKSGDPVTTTYHFIIINPNQKMSFFDIPSSFGFTITQIIKGYNSYPFTDNTGITLSSTSTGNGRYTITMQAYVADLLSYKEFSFVVEINDETPTIACSANYGTNTTDTITITYNRNIIYGQIGESYITITGLGTIYINSNTASDNSRSTVQITGAGTYWIQLFTADGNLVASYKITKSDPLNGTAIFIIVIVVLLAVVLTVVFILIRRRVRVR